MISRTGGNSPVLVFSIAFALLMLHHQCFSLCKIGQATAVKRIDEAPVCYISIIDLGKDNKKHFYEF